jgi:hypothetical protein
MNRTTLVLSELLLLSGLSFAQQPAGNTPTSHTEHVQARGCVRPGKEEGCFVLHDIKRHRFYDLTFESTGSKPDLYTHISLEGVGYPHDAHCSRGRPVHVDSWKALPGECSKPFATKPATKPQAQ